jgi:hypothetical protein
MEDSVADGEQRLYAFGPFGVSVCEGPYGVFKWQKKNMIVVELTDRCIRGVVDRRLVLFRLRRRRGGLSFEIPYASIVSAQLLPHPARLGLMQVLDIKYREADQVRETSITSYNAAVQNAFAILRSYAPC